MEEARAGEGRAPSVEDRTQAPLSVLGRGVECRALATAGVWDGGKCWRQWRKN